MRKALFRTCGIKAFAVSLALLGLSALVAAPSAFALGGGYAPPFPVPVGPGGFRTIVTTKTVPSTGGTVDGSAYHAAITIDVPAGSFPHGGQVVVTAGAPCTIDVGRGRFVVADFGVIVINPNTGLPLAGPFVPAVGIVITNSSITASDSLDAIGPAGQTYSVPGAAVTTGMASATFTHQPGDLAVIASGQRPAGICPASTPHSGRPRPRATQNGPHRANRWLTRFTALWRGPF